MRISGQHHIVVLLIIVFVGVHINSIYIYIYIYIYMRWVQVTSGVTLFLNHWI